MSLRVLESRSAEPEVRIGISKSVEKLAVRRNRMKRLIREGLRRIRLEPGRIYWLRVRRCPKDATAAAVAKELIDVFR